MFLTILKSREGEPCPGVSARIEMVVCFRRRNHRSGSPFMKSSGGRGRPGIHRPCVARADNSTAGQLALLIGVHVLAPRWLASHADEPLSRSGSLVFTQPL